MHRNDGDPSSEQLDTSSLPEDVFFSQRIVSMDFYSTTPSTEFDLGYSEFRNSDIWKVPVIKIFGSTPKGQKTCTHVHGIFPYITILDDGSIENLEYKIAQGIDNALNEFLPSAAISKFKTRKSMQHVFKVVKVSGRTFYGYRHMEETFLRIYFYNPWVTRKAADCLLNGSILGKAFQPFDAHIPYHQQFMIDCNLYGMNLVHYNSAKFRQNPGDTSRISVSPVSCRHSNSNSSRTSSAVTTVWKLSQLPESLFSTSLDKTTRCELEIDVLAADIVTRTSRSNVRSLNPGIDSIWQDEIVRRRQFKDETWSQITAPESQPRIYDGEVFTAEAMFKNILMEKLSSISVKGDDILPPQFSETCNERSFIVPSSQVQHHHHTDDSFASMPSTGTKLGRKYDEDPDDDELFNLFKEFMHEKADDNMDDPDEVVDIGSALQQRQPENDAINAGAGDNEDELQDDNHWEQSFLSETILAGLLPEDSESNNATSESPDSLTEEKRNVSQNNIIFQGDGQGGDSQDSESGSEDQSASQPTRRSVRLLSGRGNHTKSCSCCQEKSQKKEVKLASTGRLSLSTRRKLSQSQTSQSKVASPTSANTLESEVVDTVKEIHETDSSKVIEPLPSTPVAHKLKSTDKVLGGEKSIEICDKEKGPGFSKKKSLVIYQKYKPVVRLERLELSQIPQSTRKESPAKAIPIPNSPASPIAPSIITLSDDDAKEPVISILDSKDSQKVKETGLGSPHSFHANVNVRRRRNLKRRASQLGEKAGVKAIANETAKHSNLTSEDESNKIMTTVDNNSSSIELIEPAETGTSFSKHDILGTEPEDLTRDHDEELEDSQENQLGQSEPEPTEKETASTVDSQTFVDNFSQTEDYSSVGVRGTDTDTDRYMRKRVSIAVQTDSQSCSAPCCCTCGSISSQFNQNSGGSVNNQNEDIKIIPRIDVTHSPVKDNVITRQSVITLTPSRQIKKDNPTPNDTTAQMATTPLQVPKLTPKKSPARTPRKRFFTLNLAPGISQVNRSARRTSYKSFFKRMLRRNQMSPRSSEVQGDEDEPINSFYDYDCNSSFSKQDSEPVQEKMSLFQIKRSISRANSRKRRLKIRAKRLKADASAPDIFDDEFEPMKAPSTYKRIVKFLMNQYPELETPEENSLEKEDVSSVENTPEKVRKVYLGSSDDEEGSGDKSMMSTNSPHLVALERSCKTPNSQPLSVWSAITPKSILRSANISARQRGVRRKRRIRWDDASPQAPKSKSGNRGPEAVKVAPLLTELSHLSKSMNASELDGPSPRNRFGFEHDMSNLQDAKALHQHQYITIMSLEVHCETRNDLIPDPALDKIVGIFVFIFNDWPDYHHKSQQVFKCLLTSAVVPSENATDAKCAYFSNETELLQGFLKLYHEWDPDILVGYEIEKFSWGYVIGRASFLALELDISTQLSRLTPNSQKPDTQKRDGWDGQIPGRIVLNLWKLLRHEITVQSYTYENAAYHVLHRRVCRFNYETLSEFFNDANHRWRVLNYYAERVKGVIDIINTLDLINRTSELARLFGILFYEVFSRGSQFRVESMMLRSAKAQNFIPVSPGVGQRAKMRAPEYLPLILEPKSSYYTDPVAVLDFQSLYPSMMIAYNYDYSTVIGRVEHLGRDGRFEIGCIDSEISPHVLHQLKDNIHISPAGVAFVDSSIRKGILPEMLEQILDTRQMVKRSMKKWKNDGATLQKILDSRQLGLKLIANVTYGYTSANFSGRMPCIDIADSIVSKGRETLQRAVDFVKAGFKRWGGEVIYGDTDSIFILFRGKKRSHAFHLAQEIADEVTQLNPKPVKLKFEKIYQPCILQSKKRYVGYSYETSDQKSPTYDAKGIETVRRDGCPAVKKVLEKCLHILFTTNDKEKVHKFVELQFKKLFTGKVSMKEYTFARAFRGRQGYKPGACVPSLEIAKKATDRDPRAEPLTKERVPYVIIYDKPTLPLIQLVRTPMEFANDYTLRLNAHYYIEKAIIPALHRCLSLARIDVSQWYKALPRKYLRNFLEENVTGKGTMDDYIQHDNCFRCDNKTDKGVCGVCDSDLQKSTSLLLHMSSDLSSKLDTACQICELCSGDDDKCSNTDCPVFHKLLRYEREEHYNRQLLVKLKTFEI